MIIVNTMQLDIKFTLKFMTFFAKGEYMKNFLNQTLNTTANKTNTLCRVELKQMTVVLQLIAYRRPSHSSKLKGIMLQRNF